MKIIGNKMDINSAIENYNILTKSQKKILKSLLEVAVNNEVIITIEEIAKINKATRATVTTAIEVFKKNDIISVPNQTGIRFSSCIINQDKINQIINHYNNKIKLL